MKEFLPADIRGSTLIYKAQEIYAHVHRPHLVLCARGSWVACSSTSELFLARTQEEVGELAYRYFQPVDGSVDCYVGCVGSEFTEVICMDDVETRKEDTHDHIYPKGTGLYLSVDFSPDNGKTYTSFDMKHVSGADLVGAPESVLSQFTLRRDIYTTAYICGINGDLKRCNVYTDLLFRLNGLVTKTDVVQLTGSRWLVGQPIYLRYKNVIDRTAPQILTMEPLPGEVSHHA